MTTCSRKHAQDAVLGIGDVHAGAESKRTFLFQLSVIDPVLQGRGPDFEVPHCLVVGIFGKEVGAYFDGIVESATPKPALR